MTHSRVYYIMYEAQGWGFSKAQSTLPHVGHCADGGHNPQPRRGL